MGLGMNRFMFSVVDFAELSVRGLRVTILNPDGTDATLYGDERRKSILPNPIVLATGGVVAFWSSLDRVDVVIRDVVRGRCRIRNLSVLDHRVTFEPDSSLCSLAGSLAGGPVVDSSGSGGGSGEVAIHSPIMLDFGSMLIGDMYRIHAQIKSDVDPTAGIKHPQYALRVGDWQLQNVRTVWNGLYDVGIHRVEMLVEIIVAATGENGVIQYAFRELNEVLVGEGTQESPIYYYMRYITRLGGGPYSGAIYDLRGSIPINFVCVGNGPHTKWDVSMEMLSVETLRKP